MLVTWGQGGIPFAGNVALSQTRLSDDKVLLDWNHKPVFGTTTGMLRYDNDSLGNVVNRQVFNDDVVGSAFRANKPSSETEIIVDGKNQCLKNENSRMTIESRAGATIYSNEGFGFRLIAKLSNIPTGVIHYYPGRVFSCPALSAEFTARNTGISPNALGFRYVSPATGWQAGSLRNQTDNSWHEYVFQYDNAKMFLRIWWNGVSYHSREADLTNNNYAVNIPATSSRLYASQFRSDNSLDFRFDEWEVWKGINYDVDSTTIPTYGIHHSTGTVTLLNSTAAGKLTAIDAIATGKITKIEHYNDNWSTIASNSAGLTFPLTGIDIFSSGLFRLTLASTDTELQRDTPELISFSANLEPTSGRKIIQPYRFGPKLIHIGGVI